MGLAQAGTGAYDGMRDSLRQARLAEAAHHEAVLALRDGKSLRLQVLKDDLAPIVASSPDVAQAFDLALIPGENPKLWIDLVTAVVMEPDHRTYRLVQDSQAGREMLLETADRTEMTERIKLHMAHRIIARERQIAATGPVAQVAPAYGTGAVILAWLSGFALGVLVLLVSAIYMKILNF